MTIEMDYVASETIDQPQFSLAMFRQDGIQINSPNSFTAGLDTGLVNGRGCVRYKIEHLSLLPSIYHLTVAIHDKQGVHTFDYRERAYTFQVTYTERPETHGIVSLPASWEVVRE